MNTTWRRVVEAAVVLVLVFGGLLAAAGWYFSAELEAEALSIIRPSDTPDLVVTAVSPASIRLEPAPGEHPGDGWKHPGTFGLDWAGGYGHVTAIVEQGEDYVVREFQPIEGTPAVGTLVRVDGFAFPGDPLRAHGLAFEEVTFAAPLGDLAAWYIDAPGDTWAILIHGQNANRREFLRVLPTLHDAGLKMLVITYRNDVGAPLESDKRLHYGATEWEDLQAAVTYARNHGAKKIVLYGSSMGGAIVASYLIHDSGHEDVVAVVLDAPPLDFAEAVAHGAPGWVPGIVLEAGKFFAARRYAVDWSELDYLQHASVFDVPTLLFHGTADKRVPIATSERLAALRPGIVTFVSVEDAGHVRSWNANRQLYEDTLAQFLRTRVP